MRILALVILALLNLYNTTAQADEPKKRLWYGQEAHYKTRLQILYQEMWSKRPSEDCIVPFVLRPLNKLAMSVAISRDATHQNITMGGRVVSYIPLRFRPKIEISIAHVLDYGKIKLERQRIWIMTPPIVSFFVKTNPFFATIEGVFGDSIDLHITLTSVENPEKYCPVIYRLTGERLEKPPVI